MLRVGVAVPDTFPESEIGTPSLRHWYVGELPTALTVQEMLRPAYNVAAGGVGWSAIPGGNSPPVKAAPKISDSSEADNARLKTATSSIRPLKKLPVASSTPPPPMRNGNAETP